jgi:ABC-type sugar transport system ATPase subunit
MLTLKNVTKSYKTNKVLQDVSLTIRDGEMCSLLGPSGSGKTTILRLVAGFMECDSGEILLDNVNVDSVPAYKRNIGVVFQDYALFPHMTVEQNVNFGMKMKKVPSREAGNRLNEALNLVGLQDYRHRYPRQLSGGQQQRVAIARVIASRSKVMLLDEPLSNLDAKLRRQVRVELRELQQKLKITTLLVTHDQEEAVTMGDHIAILNDGRIQQTGVPLELYRRPVNLFVAGFLGTPPINFFSLSVSGSNGESMGFRVPLNKIEENAHIRLKDGNYIFGIRPEDLIISRKESGVFTCTAKLIEHLGSEMLVYFDIGGKQYCCKSAIDDGIRQGDEVYFDVNYRSVTVYDPVTEQRIASESTS